jgi:hypothetical protein
VEQLVEAVTEEIGRDVVTATPVLTGFAAGNWRPSLNAPATVPITFNDPTGSATIARISTTARQYRIRDTVFIVNNAPYIADLNRGSSPKAPAGFVEAAVRSGTARAIARLSQGGLTSGN